MFCRIIKQLYLALSVLHLLEGGVLTCSLPFLAPFLPVPFPHCIYWHGERYRFFSNCSQMWKKGLLSCNHTGVKRMWNEGWGGKGLPVVRRRLWTSVFLLPRRAVPTDGLQHHLRASGFQLWMPSMTKCRFILGTKNIPLSSKENYSHHSFLWNTCSFWAKASSAKAVGCLWRGGQMGMGTNWAQFVPGGWAGS